MFVSRYVFVLGGVLQHLQGTCQAKIYSNIYIIITWLQHELQPRNGDSVADISATADGVGLIRCPIRLNMFLT